MIGTGVILDSTTFNKIIEKIDKGKEIAVGLSENEISEITIELTGLIGSRNKPGKISSINKGTKWRFLSEGTV
jgi:hypothetical protein